MDRDVVLANLHGGFYESFCKKISRSAGGYYNAEDVVQEAFSRALLYWDSYDPNRVPVLTWFTSILNNSLRDFQRELMDGGMTRAATDEEFEDSGADFCEELLHDEGIYKDVLKGIDKHSHPAKDILFLYFLREYKPREICQVLDVKVDTVRAYVWRFKKEMEGKLGRKYFRH